PNLWGRAIHPRSLTSHFKRAIIAARVPLINFHALRHTHASILLKIGTTVNVVSKRLGHANASMTLDVYSHVMSGMNEEAALNCEKCLGGDVPAVAPRPSVDKLGGQVQAEKEGYSVA